MKKEVWGPIVWKVLHCFTIKIKDEHFDSQKKDIVKMISSICSNLPCPICSTHAMGMLRKYKVDHIDTKDKLIKILYIIHSEVNKRIKNPIYDYNKLHGHYTSLNFKQFSFNRKN